LILVFIWLSVAICNWRDSIFHALLAGGFKAPRNSPAEQKEGTALKLTALFLLQTIGSALHRTPLLSNPGSIAVVKSNGTKVSRT
jgi:hypothetical protein